MNKSLLSLSPSAFALCFSLISAANDVRLDGETIRASRAPAVGFSDSCIAIAHLNGRQEVPPRDTPATGEFQLRIEGERATFRLIVANIDNVFKAHVHLGPPDSAGPPVVLLDSLPSASGPSNGVLKEGAFTAADFIRVFAGRPWEVFSRALARGDLYVNVHTDDGVPPINTGPGDFGPVGEIRGPLRIVGRCR